MDEPPHIIDTDTEETAEEFLQQISGRSGAAARGSGQGGRAAGPARRDGHVPTQVGGVRPWVAASASLLVPGAGQLLNGDRALALLFLSLGGLGAAMAYFAANTWKSLVRLGSIFDVAASALSAVLFIAGVLLPLLWMVGVAQAYARATRGSKPWPFAGLTIVPGLASILVPGWGQLLNGQLGKAVTFQVVWILGGYIAGASLLWPEPWAGFDRTARLFAGWPFTVVQVAAVALAGLAWVVAIYDAFLTARHRSD